MAHSFPTETVIRAFVLVLDHHSTEKASEYLKNFSDIEGRYPTGHTIRNWAKKGELIGIDWYKFREIADTVRMTVASDNIVRNTPKAYQQFVEDAKADLDKLQEILYHQLGQISFQKPSDVKHILEARKALEEEMDWRIEQTEEITQVVGGILRACAEYVHNQYNEEVVKKALELLLDATAEEFQRFLAFGGDTEHYEIATGSGSASRRLRPRSNGQGDSEL